MGRFLSLLLGILMFSLPAQARMYKWVDEKGSVHFSNTVPPHNAQTVSPVDEKGGESGDRAMRMQQEQGNQAVPGRTDLPAAGRESSPNQPGSQSGRQDLSQPQTATGKDAGSERGGDSQVADRSIAGTYTVTIYELEVVDSTVTEWLALPRWQDVSPKEPDADIKTHPFLPQEKYKILPDDQYREPTEMEKEFDFYFYNQQGGGAG